MAPTPPTPKAINGPNSSSNPFAPFAGSTKFTSPPSAYRRNGASTSAPGLTSPLAAAAQAYSKGVLGGLDALNAAKIPGADGVLGIGGVLGSSLPGASGMRGGNSVINEASSDSEEDAFSPKKRRWSKPIEEEVL